MRPNGGGLLAVALLSILLSSTAVAGELAVLITQMQQHNPEREQARLAALGSAAQLRQQQGRLRPNVALSAGISRNKQKVLTSDSRFFTDSIFSSGDLTLSLQQALYQPALQQGRAIAESGLKHRQLQQQQTNQRTLFTLSRQYLDWLNALHQQQTVAQSWHLQSETLAQVQERFQLGMATRADRDEAKAQLALAKAQKINAQRQVTIAIQRLHETLGGDWNDLAMPSIDFNEAAFRHFVQQDLANAKVWLERALRQHPEWLAGQQLKRQARYRLQQQKDINGPTLDAVLSERYSKSGGGFARQTLDTSIGLQFSMPLYQGGSLDAAEQEAELALRGQEAALHGLQNRMRREISSDWQQLVDQGDLLSARREVEQAARTALAATQAGFELGQRTALDVLGQRTRLEQAIGERIASRFQWLQLWLSLHWHAGVLSQADVLQLEPLFLNGSAHH